MHSLNAKVFETLQAYADAVFCGRKTRKLCCHLIEPRAASEYFQKGAPQCLSVFLIPV